MKKFLVIAAALIISISAFSQNYKNAIGLRLGYDFSVTYKTFVSEANFMEFGVNLHPWGGFGVNAYAFYDWNFNVGPEGLAVYVGPGITAGYWGGFAASINAQLGIEYKFSSIPLALSLDYMPGLGFYTGGDGFHMGYSAYFGGLGIKYTF